jgi:hypothetical protein
MPEPESTIGVIRGEFDQRGDHALGHGHREHRDVVGDRVRLEALVDPIQAIHGPGGSAAEDLFQSLEALGEV